MACSPDSKLKKSGTNENHERFLILNPDAPFHRSNAMSVRDAIDNFSNADHKSNAAKSILHDAASNAGAKFYKAYSHSKERVDQAIDSASDGVERAEHYLIDQIKRQPVSAALIAMGAGIAIGLMLSRRD
jgi:ElaB/YqjD/DUF883 family membrane-anchored ribosome-binding protein